MRELDAREEWMAYGVPGRGRGRGHHRLWHTDLPVFARYRT